MRFTVMKSGLEKLEKLYLKKLSARIIALRKGKKMSQEKLANESDIARSLMRGYERNERRWTNWCQGYEKRKNMEEKKFI